MITISWAALGTVAVVAIVTTLLFVTLLSGGIRLVSIAVVRGNRGQNGAGARIGGFTLVGLAAVLVLYGIYLIVPFFH